MSETRRNKADYAVKAVTSAVSILELLSLSEHELTLMDIADALKLTKLNCSKLLATLSEYGYVEQSRYTNNYRLGIKTFQISNAYINKLNVIEASNDYLHNLSKSLNESAHISILQDGNVVYLNAIETSSPVRVVPRLGNFGPAYATATGKAQLSCLDTKKVEGYYSKGFTKYTENTISNIADLLVELEIVRKNGYAVDNEEYQPCVVCVGAPIQNFMGKVICGISVVAPKERMDEDRIENIIAPAVVASADSISAKFGFAKQ